MRTDPTDRDQQRPGSLYQDAPYPYQSLDPEGGILEINQAWLDLFGYRQDEVVGRRWVDFLAPDSQALVPERFRVFKQVGQIAGLFFEVVRKDGAVIPVRVDGRIVRAPGGQMQRTHCFLLDMRPELEARRELEESERKYRRLVDLALGGIWQVDPQGRTTYVNQALADMLECAPEDILGRRFTDFMDERGAEQAGRFFERRRRGLPDQYDFEFLTAGGRRVTAFVNARPLFDEDGAFAGGSAEVIDVTHKRRCEKEAFHTQKLESLGVMAGGIAHDFNNLLQAMVGNLDLIEQETPAIPAVLTYLEEIRGAAARARDLCRQMLTYGGRAQYDPADVQLGEIVEGIAELIAASIDKRAELRIETGGELPAVFGDAAQLRQVVMNLVANASEALGGGPGRVAIGITAENIPAGSVEERFPGGGLAPGRFVVLRVEDTGCGMDAEVRQRLFDPFFSTKFTGRGMGMATVRGIVAAHSGAIRIRSRPHEGTVVEVALPAGTRPAPKAARSVAADGRADPAAAPVVLVADDEEMVRRMLEQMLTKLGYRVLAAANGQEALRIFARADSPIALVLLDMTMPQLDGTEAFRQIRGLDEEVPVFILSGFPPEDIATRFPAPQPDGFLQKPFSLEDLRATVKAVVGR